MFSLSLLFNPKLFNPILKSIVAFFESNDKQSWRLMLLSLIIIVLCEMAYIIEVIWYLLSNLKIFNIIKFLAIILSTLILYKYAYYSIVKTIICNAYMLVLLILQIISLVTNSKYS